MDVLAILEEYGVEGERKDDDFVALCPFHEDTNPSCSISIEKGVFHCFSCDAKGDLYAFLAAAVGVSRTVVQRHIEAGTSTPAGCSDENTCTWNRKLLESPAKLKFLRTKGITKADIEKYLLGHNGKRYSIPIYAANGSLVNIRKYLPKGKRKYINTKGCGGAALYPIERLEHNRLVITEGEFKAILLNSMGIPAISMTGGAKTWPPEWGQLFKGKEVFILYDIDDAGLAGAKKVARLLYNYAKWVKIAHLPLERRKYPTGDITNYVVDEKATRDEVVAVLGKAELWEPVKLREDLDNEVHPVHLSTSTEAKYYNKLISTKVVVSAKDTAPYMIPSKVKVKCTKDQEVCAFCPIFRLDEFHLDNKDPVLLELVNVSNERLAKNLKKAGSIPRSCSTCNFRVLESINVEEIRVMPQLELSTRASEHVVKQGFYIGHGLETNLSYTIKARVCPRPDTQYATLIVYEAAAAVDNLTNFIVREPEKLRIFQPTEWTVEGITEKLDGIYNDLAANVTRIYQRPDLHLFYDLIYHSCLYIPFGGRLIKGWAEGLVIGDSGQGKSETISTLRRHYGLGEKVDVKTASAVGLIGGLQESAKRWFVTWGIIPLNDKRLVVLEEVKGISQETIAKLTEVRSSGIAEISKIEKARTNARTRLIWISNPRGDRQILSYNFGVEAIKELVGNLEDVRRFDFAMVVTTADVERKWLNMAESECPVVEHVFTSERCQSLILWGWSRKGEDVKFTADAERRVLKASTEMGRKYSSSIPLVEAADQRLKIARLSAALAVRTYSTDSGADVIVRKCHVEYLHQFLDKLYSTMGCGYAAYSEMVMNENTLHDVDVVKKTIRELPYAGDTVRALLDSGSISVFDIADWTEMDLDQCRKLVGMLVRKNGIKRGKRNYVKTPPFIAALKELQVEGLKNETRYDKVADEEF